MIAVRTTSHLKKLIFSLSFQFGDTEIAVKKISAYHNSVRLR